MFRFIDWGLGLLAFGAYLLERQDDRRDRLTDDACRVAEQMRLQAYYWQEQYNQLYSSVHVTVVDDDNDEAEEAEEV